MCEKCICRDSMVAVVNGFISRAIILRININEDNPLIAARPK